jgi:hypothetical protein
MLVCMNHDEYIAPHEAARILCVEPSTLRRWYLDGRLAGVAIRRTAGGQRRYSRADIEHLAETARFAPPAPAVKDELPASVFDSTLTAPSFQDVLSMMREQVRPPSYAELAVKALMETNSLYAAKLVISELPAPFEYDPSDWDAMDVLEDDDELEMTPMAEEPMPVLGPPTFRRHVIPGMSHSSSPGSPVPAAHELMIQQGRAQWLQWVPFDDYALAEARELHEILDGMGWEVRDCGIDDSERHFEAEANFDSAQEAIEDAINCGLDSIQWQPHGSEWAVDIDIRDDRARVGSVQRTLKSA